MPRRPRFDAPGAIHHVMARGLERRRIFADDEDRRDLVSRLERVLPESGTACLAWALLPNHVHLVVRTGPVHLSRVLARVHTGYALRFNRRHDRVGFLFQGRFKSRAASDEADALGLVRYVDRNPLRHGVVADLAALARYPWCSHAQLVGLRPPFAFECAAALDALLGCEHADRAERIARRARWLGEESDPARALVAATRGRDGCDPGAAPARDETPTRLAGSAAPDARTPVDLDTLVRGACTALGVREDALRGRAATREISRARARIARRAVLELGASPAAVARRFGVSREAVRRAVERGREAEGPRAPAGPS